MRTLFPAASLALSLACSTATAAAQAPGTDIHLASIERDGSSISFAGWTNLTSRPGYDNQPSFTPDSRTLLYTSERDGQTDIYRIRLDGGGPERVTRTAESEYSPTVMPGGERFSVIRVEADSTQRLWSFGLDGSAPELVLAEIEPVGYHAWLDGEAVALFVLGTPPTLRIADLRDGSTDAVAHDIGRSLHRVPGRAAVSFLHRDGGSPRIRALDPGTGGSRVLGRPLEGSVDYAWTPSGLLLMGSGSRLYVLDPLTDDGWRLAADLEGAGIRDITRLAVSPDGARIAVVGSDAGTR